MVTILVVDDEPDVRNTTKRVLESEGYTVITASNGDECLETMERESPNLILMDIMMPGTPVKEVIRQIGGIPVVFLSVVRVEEAEKRVIMERDNVVGFIQKPYDVAELLRDVKRFLSAYS